MLPSILFTFFSFRLKTTQFTFLTFLLPCELPLLKLSQFALLSLFLAHNNNKSLFSLKTDYQRELIFQILHQHDNFSLEYSLSMLKYHETLKNVSLLLLLILVISSQRSQMWNLLLCLHIAYGRFSLERLCRILLV